MKIITNCVFCENEMMVSKITKILQDTAVELKMQAEFEKRVDEAGRLWVDIKTPSSQDSTYSHMLQRIGRAYREGHNQVTMNW